jgi:hypothetical protein
VARSRTFRASDLVSRRFPKRNPGVLTVDVSFFYFRVNVSDPQLDTCGMDVQCTFKYRSSAARFLLREYPGSIV